MLLYKFDKMPGTTAIPYYEDDGKTIAGYFEGNSLLSFYPAIEIDGVKYIDDITTGNLYKYSERNFRTYESVESTVIPLCTTGLAIYNKTESGREELTRVSRGGKIYLTLDFTTSDAGDIFARAFTLDNRTGGFAVENGYIPYKNARNNFANVALTGTKFTTVLTDGKVDPEKVESAKDQQPVMLRAARANSLGVEVNTSTNGKTATGKSIVGTTGKASIDGNVQLTYATQVARRHPNIVQNESGYPTVISYNSSTKLYEYDYSLNYSSDVTNFTKFEKHHNLEQRSINTNRKANLQKYNRFKLPFPDDVINRGFMHVFMTRPDLNIFFNDELSTQCSNDPFLRYVKKRNPGLLSQLILNNGTNHQFMMLPSNKIKGFSVSDKGINSASMGKSRSGYSVHYGRRRDSDVGNDLSITYKETHGLDILYLHQVWIDYIENVFKGKWVSKDLYIRGRILDYAVSLYVIVVAEDFETILFWTKYYGVFPVNVPFSSISWGGEKDLVSNIEPSISYRCAWKEDLNPVTLAELNMNAFCDKVPDKALYQKTYDPTIGASGNTWVGAPFVEFVTYDEDGSGDLTDGGKVTPKLRFRTKVT